MSVAGRHSGGAHGGRGSEPTIRSVGDELQTDETFEHAIIRKKRTPLYFGWNRNRDGPRHHRKRIGIKPVVVSNLYVNHHSVDPQLLVLFDQHDLL